MSSNKLLVKSTNSTDISAPPPGVKWVLVADDKVSTDVAVSESKDPVSDIPPSIGLSREFLRTQLTGRFDGLKMKSRTKVDQTYTLRLGAQSPITTTAGGVIAAAVLANPNGTFIEWSSFSPLFDEVKLVSLRVEIFMLCGTTQATASFGCFLSNTTTPSSEQAVLASGNSKKLGCNNNTSIPCKIKLVPGTLNWATTSSPAPGPYAGCPGSIQVYGSGFTPSTTITQMGVFGQYLLRGRV